MNFSGLLLFFALFLGIRYLMRTFGNRVHFDVNEKEGALALRALYVIAHDIIHADGRAEEAELRMMVKMVRRVLGDPHLDANFIIQEYQKHAGQPLQPHEFGSLSMRYRQTLFAVAMNIAISDMQITSGEIEQLKIIAGHLDMPPDQMDELFRRLGGGWDGSSAGPGGYDMPSSSNMRDWAYQELELEPGASQKDIKRAYKKMGMKHHPDRASADKKDEATEKFKQIQEAYSILREKEA